MDIKEKRGFTLIELLVVVAIIGLLAGGITLSFSYAQKRGRDTQRIADLNSVALALSAYYADKHIYPNSTGDDGAARFDHLGSATPEPLTPRYLLNLPSDTAGHLYRYGCNGVAPAPSCSSYTLAVELELNRDQPDGSQATGYRITNGEIAQY